MSAGLDSGEVRRALDLPDSETAEARASEADGAPSGGDPGGRTARHFSSVAIDSRELEPGALFVALSGERHDGFDFLAEAAARGARGAVVPAGRPLPDLDLEWFPVSDTERALGELGRFARRRADARVVAITGSSGKTTVKEMLAAALREARRVHRTAGNLNSQIGLPLTILAAPPEAEIWVLELGTSVPGEIGRLTEIASPHDALITTVGPAHLEGFGDERGVLAEKMALVEGARPGGAVVVGERPPELPRAAREVRPDTVVAGLDEGADYRPERWDWGPEHAEFTRRGVEYRVRAGGEHHLRDAVLAAALAEELGVAPGEAARGLGSFRPLGMRGAVRQFGGLTVVADCYNANPESFSAAIEFCVSAFPGRRLAAAVGSMLELGEHAEAAHRSVARRLREAGFSPVAATGEFVSAFEDAPRANGSLLAAEDAEEAGRRLAGELAGDEVVLVKASRGARLERVVEMLRHAFGEGA